MSKTSNTTERELLGPVVARPMRELDPEVAERDPELALFMDDPALVERSASGMWEVDAACRNMGVDGFFIEPRQSRPTPQYLQTVKAAAVICHTACKVRPECRIAAYLNKEDHGIWGGKSPVERPETETARKHRTNHARLSRRERGQAA